VYTNQIEHCCQYRCKLYSTHPCCIISCKKENNENDSVFQLNYQQEITQCFGCEVNQTLNCCHFSISCQKVLIGYMFSAQHMSEHIEYTPYYYDFCFWQWQLYIHWYQSRLLQQYRSRNISKQKHTYILWVTHRYWWHSLECCIGQQKGHIVMYT